METNLLCTKNFMASVLVLLFYKMCILFVLVDNIKFCCISVLMSDLCCKYEAQVN